MFVQLMRVFFSPNPAIVSIDSTKDVEGSLVRKDKIGQKMIVTVDLLNESIASIDTCGVILSLQMLNYLNLVRSKSYSHVESYELWISEAPAAENLLTDVCGLSSIASRTSSTR